MDSSNLKIRLELISDTCPGGDAPEDSGVDRMLEIDSTTGLPLLRGRAVKGLIVEEAALLLASPAVDSDWNAVARRLFGEPRSHDFLGGDGAGVISFRDGGLPPSVSRALLRGVELEHWSRSEVLDALCTVRRQTAVDPETGAPRPRSLRSTRLLRSGLELECPLIAQRQLSEQELALLAGCCAALRRVGLHRNSGWGRVRTRLLVAGADVTHKLALLRNPPDEGAALRSHHAGVTSQAVFELDSGRSEANEMSGVRNGKSPQIGAVLTFRLVLEGPALFPRSGADPNAVETLPYVPGSTLLGACARRFLGEQRPSDAARDATFRRLFLTGEVRWLNAYLEGPNAVRMLPAPRALAVTKHSPMAWPTEAHDRLAGFDPRGEQWVPLPADAFVWPEERDDGTLALHVGEPEIEWRLHHQRDREAGRAVDGALFAYSSLSAAQTFRGVVLCDDGAGASRVRDLLEKEEPLFLGRSKGASYGGPAIIDSVELHDRSAWAEAHASDDEDDAPLILTLLSTYLGRDSGGEGTPEAFFAELAAGLDVDPGRIGDRARFLESVPADGYVAQWQMPRPREVGLRAGCAILLDPEIRRSRLLADLLWRGLGGRRAEGFGRFSVSLERPGAMVLTPFEPPPKQVEAPAPIASDPLVAPIERSLVRTRATRALRRHALDLQARSRSVPSPSLLSRLREQVRRSPDAASLEDFVAGSEGRVAGKALKQWHIEGQQFPAWLESFVKDREERPAGWRSVVELPPGYQLPRESSDAWPLLRDFLDVFLQEARRRRQQSALAEEAAVTGGASR